MDSLFDTIVSGGPIMIPLGICSVIALAWVFERLVRLRSSALGDRALGTRLVTALREGGPSQAIVVARAHPSRLGSIFEPALARWQEGRSALEKAVEDAGSREVRSLVASLRPLSVITAIAPLLGLLGTVLGIIIAFREIAVSNAMGKPEALSSGIAQALVTTAAGLAIAIPTQAAYFWFRSRIDRFARRVEDIGDELLALHGQPVRAAPQSAPPVAAPAPSMPATLAPSATVSA